MNGKRSIAALIGCWLLAAAPGAAQSFKIINGWGGVGGWFNPDLGKHSSTIYYNNRLQIFYFDGYWGTLHHTDYLNQNDFRHELLDGDGGANGRIEAFLDWDIATAVSGGQLHVFYFDGTNGDLRHGWWSPGQPWRFETLDGAGGSGGRTTSLVGAQIAAANVGGFLNVFYLDSTEQRLRRGRWTGSTWLFERFDGWGGFDGRVDAEVGWHLSAIDAGSYSTHVFYYDRTNGDLRHARWDGGAGRWAFQTLDGAGGTDGRLAANVGWHTRPVFADYSIDVYYHDKSGMDLRRGSYSLLDGTWSFETIDGHSWDAGRTFNDVGGSDITVLHYGWKTHVFYLDRSAGNIRHAARDGSGTWTFQVLDGAGGSNGRVDANVGWYTSGAVLSSLVGSLHVFYYDVTSKDLRGVWF